MRAFLTPRHFNAAILVVDDMEFNRMLICDILEREGFTNLIQASNGIEALHLVDTQRIDLIILDLVMPQMDGFTFCKTMRDRNMARRIPIFVQTAMGDSEERLEIFNIGASDLIMKPINPTELVLRLCLHIVYAFSFNELIEYQKRMEEELELAEQAQRSLMPDAATTESLMQSHGTFISSYYQPSSKIGGDLWNVAAINETKLAIYAIDIAGHGTTAAINAFRLHSHIHVEALRDLSPAEYLQQLNARAAKIFRPGQFSTAFFATLDLAENTLEYASAAFTTPMIFSPKSKEIRALPSNGVPIGVIENAAYTNVKKKFLPNDTLLIYSDALIETRRKETGAFLNEIDVELHLTKHMATQASVASAQTRTIAALLGAINAGDDQQHVTDDLMIVMCTRTR